MSTFINNVLALFCKDEAKMLIYLEVLIKYYPLPSLARYEKGFTAQRVESGRN
ncbi:MAG: hypothetical protein AB8V19_01130 [Candidatus Midichloria sp.]|uniref:Uncharacterized protein n=1 Tax=Hyalomma marginatum TaxID=34627 RepID=A0A8S4C3F8_9ACAR|nr:hypothetical protein MHYMCMPASI_00026 [Hyalomma marginatum]CAG7591701.1 hypothetical protein MHYMCMPSP_00524 [Hyalomma marginatum]